MVYSACVLVPSHRPNTHLVRIAFMVLTLPVTVMLPVVFFCNMSTGILKFKSARSAGHIILNKIFKKKIYLRKIPMAFLKKTHKICSLPHSPLLKKKQ